MQRGQVDAFLRGKLAAKIGVVLPAEGNHPGGPLDANTLLISDDASDPRFRVFQTADVRILAARLHAHVEAKGITALPAQAQAARELLRDGLCSFRTDPEHGREVWDEATGKFVRKCSGWCAHLDRWQAEGVV